MRIGIDVGGTNTDAVLMNQQTVMGAVKSPTTTDITQGIVAALRALIAQTQVNLATLDAVMIGTTHFTNAVIERKHLQPTACIRLGLPSGVSLPPMVDWNPALREAIHGTYYLAHGGHEFDGREISPFDAQEIGTIAAQIRDAGVRAVAISSVFSPVNNECEARAAAIVKDIIPDVKITLSSNIGGLGLLERENAAIMNACLQALAARTVQSFGAALRQMQIDAPFFISQNDGTLMGAAFAADYPVRTFASGATNSMRGAAFLSGVKDALVIDVGGTTTDVGVLQQGFPRAAGVAVEVGGVRTNFRMPDTYSIGLGGGTIVHPQQYTLAEQSVGYELLQRARVFGGDTLTATDVIVAAGFAALGDPARVADLPPALVERVLHEIRARVNLAVDRMKTDATPVPVILVGGGSLLIQHDIEGTTEIIRPPHFAVANAVGAAIAQVGGECDRIFSFADQPREDALAQAKQEACARAIAAGADPQTVEVVDIEEVPLAYLPNNVTRIAVKAVGDLHAL